MAIAFVQKTAQFSATAASSVTSSTLTTTAGNTGILTISTWASSGSVAPTIVDSKSNTGTVDQSLLDSGASASRSSIGSIPLATAGASHSWQMNLPTGTYCEGNVSEFSGLSTTPFDVSAGTQIPVGVATITATTATTNQADELVIGEIVTNFSSPNTAVSDPPTGYTSIGVMATDTATIGYEAAYKIVAATGAQSVTWTFNSSSFTACCSIATYKMASAADTLMGQACL